MKEKLEAFAALIEAEQKQRLIAQGCNPEHRHNVTIRPAAKYTKVDIGDSGKYMVVNATGEIFGIKGYGVIHRGHQYGTLDTINEWYWGDYNAMKRTPAVNAALAKHNFEVRKEHAV